MDVGALNLKYTKIEPWSPEADDVMKIILNYPKKRNCLSKDMMLEIAKVICAMNDTQAPNIKVIILTHDIKNSKVFSSGHDLQEMYANIRDQAFLQQLFKTCNQLMTTVHESAIPIICMVNGMCTAAGFELVLSCDLAVCTKESSFATPGVNIGLFCHTPSVQVARAVTSTKHAKQLLLTGDPIDATTAFRMGFVNFVCDDTDQLLQKTQDIAFKIRSKSQAVIAFGKQSFRAHSKENNLKDAYQIASHNMVQNLMEYEDATEGITAFLTKRKPNWSHQKQSKL